MYAKYKMKCVRCKKNYVIVTWKTKFPECYDCQKKELESKITDKKMKEMFDIPEEFYKNNSFLRSIKINYIRYKNLSENQEKAFKDAVEKMKNPKKDEKDNNKPGPQFGTS